jgi:hypothetical protein
MIRIVKRYGKKGLTKTTMGFFLFSIVVFFLFLYLGGRVANYCNTSKKYTGYVKEKTRHYKKNETSSIEDTVYSFVVKFDSLGDKVLDVDRKTFDSKKVNSYIIHRYKKNELETTTDPTSGNILYLYNFAVLFFLLVFTIILLSNIYNLIYIILTGYKIIYINKKHREIDPYNEEIWEDDDKISKFFVESHFRYFK